MPHLQYRFNRPLADDARESLTSWTTRTFADVMETGTDHVAVSITEHPQTALSLGRADSGDPVAVLDADVRGGRTFGQRERFAQAVIEHLEAELEIPGDHSYVVYTEHPGEDFVLDEGALESWDDAESESGALDWRVAEDDAGALE